MLAITHLRRRSLAVLALAVARMERASEDEAAEAIWAVTGGRQRACEF